MDSHTTFSSAVTPTFDSKHFSRTELRAARTLQEEYQTLLAETDRVQRDLQTAQNNFDYLFGQKEIDACIYRIRTSQCRYESLLLKLQELKDRMNNLSENSDKKQPTDR